jgi:hypothetical protein
VGTEAFLRLIILHLALIAVFGVLLPYRRGLDFLGPVMISAYACLGVLFAAPAAAMAFAGKRPQSMKEAFARVAKAVGYGEGFALILLIGGIVTVSLTQGRRLLLPELDVLAAAALLGLTGSFALALLAGWITLRFSAGVARGTMRVIFLLLLVAFFFRQQRLPEIALRGSTYAVAAAAFMVLLLRREVRPQ